MCHQYFWSVFKQTIHFKCVSCYFLGLHLHKDAFKANIHRLKWTNFWFCAFKSWYFDLSWHLFMIVAETWVRTFKTAKHELTRVLAGKLDGRVAHVCDALTVLLVAEVHAVRVSITAPSHRNTQTVHSALELIRVATAGRPRGCRQRQKWDTQLQCSRVNTRTKAQTCLIIWW